MSTRPPRRCSTHLPPFETNDTADVKRPGWVRSECRKCGAFLGFRDTARDSTPESSHTKGKRK